MRDIKFDEAIFYPPLKDKEKIFIIKARKIVEIIRNENELFFENIKVLKHFV